MAEKTFKIMCNSKEYLTQDTIAQALLSQVTLKDDNPQVFFGVIECRNSSEPVCEECAPTNQ